VPPAHPKTIIDLSGDSPEKTPMSQKRISTIVPTSPSRLRALERELKVVCEREATVVTQLQNTHSEKRKLEDQFGAERTLRRKLEHKLEDLQGQLDVSKKMETFALEQMKREVDARRRAEEKAEFERERRREIETEIKTRGSNKPLFEDLADMFQRAAKGEGIILPTANRSNRGSER
jgi:chromosome segregation ATPase